MSHRLASAGAVWDADPSAGDWIEPLLAEFGPTIGGNVPSGYAAHAVIAIPDPDAEPDAPPYRFTWIDALLDALEPFTGDQLVHCGLWEGWAELYDHGADPRTAPGMTVLVAWPEGEQPSEAEEDEAQRRAQESLVELRVERPDAAPLELPHRRYHLWTGQLRSASAFRGLISEPPSLIWPDDRSWFVAAPIYTREVAVAGSVEVIDTVLASEGLDARLADRSTELDIDD